MESIEIRETFLDFFKKKKHKIFASDKLIPSGDPTLLFTSAGMVQFKPYFLGEAKLSFPRAASCQKCLRTTDIEQVGTTSRHHTFFEMLGNFSLGDYFKEEAILWAWEFLVNKLNLSQENLWVSIFHDDEESAAIWENKVGLAGERIVRLGEKDNFWAMGDTGPCGPCSEIILDRGKDKGCGRPECRVGCNCDRFLEIWNLVFTQYNRQKGGRLSSLPRKNIDTGMGLERLAAVLQGVETNFETDLIKPIIKETEELTDFRYQEDKKKDVSFRIIADHIRAVTFLNSEGIYFSNVGRGYVTRRLLRRAARHGRLLGIKEPFLYRMVSVTGEIYSSVYPEIRQFREELSEKIIEEERRFNEVLNVGLNELEEIIRKAKSKGEKLINRESVFRLYDSFGFPVEMTEEVAREEGLKVDKAGFEAAMEEHRKLARRFWKSKAKEKVELSALNVPPTEFVGYKKLKTSAKILAVFYQEELVKESQAGREFALILDKSPFYAEAGGQVHDLGRIQGSSFSVKIEKVIRNNREQIIHWGKVKRGKVKSGAKVEAKVDSQRRGEITHSHTATHLLQAALRSIVDGNIRQAGSWVGPDYFRFDFNYSKKLTPEEITAVEDWVNARIEEKVSVKTSFKDREEAIREGAIALFGEKYGEKVRVVDVASYSTELCGGTHVKNTSEIEIFKILNEASVASGIRRIEAVTGKTGLKRLREESRILERTAKILRTSIEEVPKEVERLIKKSKGIEKQRNKDAEELPDLESLLKEVVLVNGVKVLKKHFSELNRQSLLFLIDKLRLRFSSGIVVFLSRHPDKIELVTSVSPDLIKKGYRAGELAQKISGLLGGSGGGRPDLGQGGGQNSVPIDKVLAQVERLLK